MTIVDLKCPRCQAAGNASTLDAVFHCPACEVEYPSLTVDDGALLPVLLDDDDAATGLVAAERILEGLERGHDPSEVVTDERRHFMDALSVYGVAHYGGFASPPLPTPNLQWVGQILEQAQAPRGRALIVGAATVGEALALPGGFDVVAVDGSVPMLAFASGLSVSSQPLPVAASPGCYRTAVVDLRPPARARLGAVQLVCADALNLPFEASTFALVVALGVLDSITQPARLLEECQRVLAPQGCLLLSSADNWSDDVTRPVDRLDPSAVLRAAAALGMQLVASRSNVPWRLRIHDRLNTEFAMNASVFRRSR